MYKFHNDGTLPQNGEVFVFGSNLAGIHGAGAAKVARELFGAPFGAGMGLMGMSYAIPTKNKQIETIHPIQIRMYVNQFKTFAGFFESEMKFFVTRIGCGLAGYDDSVIAPMFKGSPENCSFAKEWEKYLD